MCNGVYPITWQCQLLLQIFFSVPPCSCRIQFPAAVNCSPCYKENLCCPPGPSAATAIHRTQLTTTPQCHKGGGAVEWQISTGYSQNRMHCMALYPTKKNITLQLGIAQKILYLLARWLSKGLSLIHYRYDIPKMTAQSNFSQLGFPDQWAISASQISTVITDANGLFNYL